MPCPPGQGPASLALRVSQPAESSPFPAGSRRSARWGSAPTRTPSARKLVSALFPRESGATMSSAPGAEAYFRRSSLFWFTVISISFGYYTVKAASGVMALFRVRACGRGQVAQAQSRRPRTGAAGEGTGTRKTQEHWSRETGYSGFPCVGWARLPTR